MPEVSVIIPNYNHAQYLRQRIDSVLTQTFQDFEIIIMDDCSTDISRTIIEEYKGHPQIGNIIYNKTNSASTFKQWNKGVEHCKGELVWIAESDDVADKNFLATLVPVMHANKKIGIAYCQSFRMNSDSKITGTWKTHTDDLSSEQFNTDFVMKGTEYIERFIIHKNTIPNASGALISKDHFIAAGGADPIIKNCSDWLTWIKILMSCNVYFCATPLNYFRFHGQSVIATVSKNNENTGTYIEMYDRRMRRSLANFLKIQFPSFKAVRNINQTYIANENGEEGLYFMRNKKLFSGWVKIGKAMLDSDRRSFFILSAVRLTASHGLRYLVPKKTSASSFS